MNDGSQLDAPCCVPLDLILMLLCVPILQVFEISQLGNPCKLVGRFRIAASKGIWFGHWFLELDDGIDGKGAEFEEKVLNAGF